MIAADPRAQALDDRVGRLGFRALAHLTVKSRNLSALARELGISRQMVHRGLKAARAAGFGPEIDALPRVRAQVAPAIPGAKRGPKGGAS